MTMRFLESSRICRCLGAVAGLALVAAPVAGVAAEDTPLGAEMTGSTELEDDAGWIEARLLTGIVAKQAAREIIADIGIDYTSLAMVVLPVPKDSEDSTSMVGGRGWDVIDAADRVPVVADMVKVRDRVDGFDRQYDSIAAAAGQACKKSDFTPMFESGNKGFDAIAGAITGSLNAATPILSLLKQDFVYQGLDTHVRDGMLVTAIRSEYVAQRAIKAKTAGAAAASGPRNFAETVEMLSAKLAQPVAVEGCAKSDPYEEQRVALVTGFEGFLGQLEQPGSSGEGTLLAEAEAQLARYGLRPATLVLAIEADGASLVKRSNLTTMFGAESTTISSGVVVSYEFYESGSAGIASLKAAGVLSCMSGAVGIRKLHKAGKLKDRAVCY